MPTEFILIPGRSSRQGVTLNEGKYTDGYLDETSTLRMNPADMQRIGVSEGDEVRMWNDIGEVVVPCIDAKDECPEGIVFICYGDKSSQLMGGETHGSGMPDSKGLDVFVHPASQPKPAQPVTETAKTEVPAPRQESKAAQETAIETPTPAASASQAPTSEDPVHPDAPLQIGVTITMALFVITLIGLAVIMYLSR